MKPNSTVLAKYLKGNRMKLVVIFQSLYFKTVRFKNIIAFYTDEKTTYRADQMDEGTLPQ